MLQPLSQQVLAWGKKRPLALPEYTEGFPKRIVVGRRKKLKLDPTKAEPDPKLLQVRGYVSTSIA